MTVESMSKEYPIKNKFRKNISVLNKVLMNRTGKLIHVILMAPDLNTLFNKLLGVV